MESENAIKNIYKLARDNGYKVTALSVADRHNAKGAYSVAEITLVIPRSEDSAEARKDEVKRHEI